MDNIWFASALWIGLALVSSLISIIEEEEALNGTYKEALKKAREIAAAKGVAIHSHVIVGHEVKSIVELVNQRGFDLLVIGFMGHSAVYDRVMGSTCQSLVRLAPCTVLVVK